MYTPAMPSRSRIVPPGPKKGWLCMGLLIGAAVTLGMFIGPWLIEELNSATGRRFPDRAEVALVFALLALLFAPALTVVQRAWPVAPVDRAAAVNWAPAGTTPRDHARIERVGSASFFDQP